MRRSAGPPLRETQIKCPVLPWGPVTSAIHVMDDTNSLQPYATGNSERACRAGERHLALVGFPRRAAGLRDPHSGRGSDAGGVIILARKAEPHLAGNILTGWLYRTRGSPPLMH